MEELKEKEQEKKIYEEEEIKAKRNRIYTPPTKLEWDTAPDKEEKPRWWEKLILSIKTFFAKIISLFRTKMIPEKETVYLEKSDTMPNEEKKPEAEEDRTEEIEMKKDLDIPDEAKDTIDVVKEYEDALLAPNENENKFRILPFISHKVMEEEMSYLNKEVLFDALEYATGLRINRDTAGSGKLTFIEDLGNNKYGSIEVFENGVTLTPDIVEDGDAYLTNYGITAESMSKVQQLTDIIQKTPNFIRSLMTGELDRNAMLDMNHAFYQSLNEDFVFSEHEPEIPEGGDPTGELTYIPEEDLPFDMFEEELPPPEIDEQEIEANQPYNIEKPQAEAELLKEIQQYDPRAYRVELENCQTVNVYYQLEDESFLMTAIDKYGDVRQVFYADKPEGEFPHGEQYARKEDMHMKNPYNPLIAGLDYTIREIKPDILNFTYVKQYFQDYEEREVEKMHKNIKAVSTAQNEYDFKMEVAEILNDPNINKIHIEDGIIKIDVDYKSEIFNEELIYVPNPNDDEIPLGAAIIYDPQNPSMVTYEQEFMAGNLGGKIHTTSKEIDSSWINLPEYAYAIEFLKNNAETLDLISPRSTGKSNKEKQIEETKEMDEAFYERQLDKTRTIAKHKAIADKISTREVKRDDDEFDFDEEDFETR